MDEILTTIPDIVTEALEPEPIEEIITTVAAAPSLIPNPSNVMHNLFSILGVDLDHVPLNEFEAFTMALQFLAALFFLFWFCRFMYQLMKPILRGGL